MGLRVGRRKLLAMGFAGVVAVIAVAAWLVFGTDALIGVVLAVSIASSLGLGWLVAQTERRVSRLQLDVIASRKSWDRLDTQIDQLVAGRLDELVGQVALDTREQTENLLQVMSSSAKRADAAQQKMLETQTENLLQAVSEALAPLDRLSRTVGTESNRVVEAIKAHAPSLKQLRWETKQLFRQLEALEALYVAADPATSFPPTRSWAAGPDLLTFLYQTVRTRQPDMILECGSGVSTLVMAYALKANGQGRVVSLEHLDEYREITMGWVEQHDLAEWIDVRHAPLTDIDVHGELWPWYSIKTIPDVGIDLLLVDGPPGQTRKNARFPALPLLAGQLRPGALVILDDYAREDESIVAESWIEMFPELDLTTVDHEKGTALLETPPQWGQSA